MNTLVPLTVAVPLLVAAALAATNGLLPRLLIDAASVATALAAAVMCGLLVAHVGGGLSVYWFGGFRPHRGIAVGISFSVDRMGAGGALATRRPRMPHSYRATICSPASRCSAPWRLPVARCTAAGARLS